MNIPSSLRIIGREYDVVKLDYDDQVGGVDFDTCTIGIKSGQQKLLEADTLLHEALHVIDDIFQTDLTERQIYCVVGGILALLRDNSSLLPYINDALVSPRKL